MPGHPVGEEPPDRREVTVLGRRRQWSAEALFESGGAVHVVADVHPVQRGDPGRAGLQGPRRRIGGLGMLGCAPAADLE